MHFKSNFFFNQTMSSSQVKSAQLFSIFIVSQIVYIYTSPIQVWTRCDAMRWDEQENDWKDEENQLWIAIRKIKKWIEGYLSSIKWMNIDLWDVMGVKRSCIVWSPEDWYGCSKNQNVAILFIFSRPVVSVVVYFNNINTRKYI